MPATRRLAVRNVALSGMSVSVWSSPVVRSILLPAHAQTSSCVQGSVGDIPGKWRLELFGPAASTGEIYFHEDGSVDHTFINAWQFSNQEFRMTQGTRWVFTGVYGACGTLSGTYTHIFPNPLVGNIIVRRGDWQALKLPIH